VHNMYKIIVVVGKYHKVVIIPKVINCRQHIFAKLNYRFTSKKLLSDMFQSFQISFVNKAERTGHSLYENETKTCCDIWAVSITTEGCP
jgi:hypothetical protein